MENQPPENNEQNFPKVNSSEQKQTTASHNSNTTNDNPKENTINRKENAQQKTSIQ